MKKIFFKKKQIAHTYEGVINGNANDNNAIAKPSNWRDSAHVPYPNRITYVYGSKTNYIKTIVLITDPPSLLQD